MQRLHLNNNILLLSIKEGFYYIKNPRIKLGEQVINSSQYQIIKALDSPRSISEVALITGNSLEYTTKIVNILQQNDIVRTDTEFIIAEKIENPNFGMWIHTSNRCNLSCPYCYVNAEARGKKMTEEIWNLTSRKIVQTATERGAKSFQLKLAGGEPLLTFHVWKYKIEEIKLKLAKLGCKLKLQVLTNGTIISKEIIEFIKAYQIGVGISLDGFESYHDITRQYRSGKGSYDKVISTISVLRKNGINPYITCVITNENYLGLTSLTEYLTSQNLRFRFSLEKGTLLFIDEILPYLIESYKIVEDRIDKGLYTQFLRHTLCDLSLSKPILDSPCGVGSRYGYISELGQLHICQADSQNKSVGSIFDEENLTALIQKQNNFPELLNIAQSCKTCRYKLICHGGCPVSKVNLKSPFCEVFHIMLPVILRLRGKSILNDYMNQRKIGAYA